MSFDPTKRELCPDDNCIGVIGSDGCCRECGAVAQSAHTHSRLRGMQLPASDEPGGSDYDDDNDDGRQLCSDGGCVGLIGADGRCKECGQPACAASVDAAEPTAEPEPAAAAAQPAAKAGDPDIDERELCPDGMCVGVVGSDGRCKVCGTSAR